MNTTSTTSNALRNILRRLGRIAAVVPIALVAAAAQAAPADLARTPIAQSTTTQVKPNLMFIMDDSGSMDNEYAPDSANSSDVCFGVAAVNRIFYNPTVTYLPPLRADGTSYTDANFNSARTDGFNTSSSSTDLRQIGNLTTPSVSTTTSTTSATCSRVGGAPCQINYDNTTNVTGINGTVTTTRVWTTSCSRVSSGTCTLNTSVSESGKFYWATLRAGMTSSCSTPANYVVVRDMTAMTAAQRTNYANWYSFYRNRMLAVRSGVGRAFSMIDATRFRVGYSAISFTGVTEGTRFLNIRDFDAGTQKADFYSRLYGAAPSGYTPLRPALHKAGSYFANQISGQVDPVQYSCQRNYTILSTDGYWNTSAEVPAANYVPTRLGSSTAIGNVDGGNAVPRPLRDECNPTSDGNSCTNQNGAGVSNTLADIAMYFYETDLRTSALGNCTGAISGQNVCTNNVRSDGRRDTATHQHMTTFTVGLGVSGVLPFRADYETATSGSFFDISQGNARWPNPVTATSASLYTNNNVTARIDDLWHAAINGRGTYFAANNANDMAVSLATALDRIDQVTGSGSAATTSSLRPSQGDDWLFFATYNTVSWDGDVRAHKIDTGTGVVLNPNTPIWQAGARIAAQASRNVYMAGGTGPSNLMNFTHTNMSVAQRAYFDNLCLAGSERLSHCATLSTNARNRVTGTNVVDYLRGVRTYEFSAAAVDDRVFRTRASPLGDIVSARPVYVKRPPFSYTSNNYATFKSNNASRQAVLYVAANDGMLHALRVAEDSTGGTEMWAYVPGMVMNEMWRLADDNYDTSHRYFVDGSPVVGDVFDGTSWRTILVGGLNAGGRGYYALDITDPSNPRALWEFSVANDNDLGLTYGNPIITKLKDGTWAVAFTSGYNNVSPGSGNGFLFVRNAITGAAVSKLPTNVSGSPVGTTVDPSNLAKINAFVNDAADNTAQAIYGGDMLGNRWRFDHDDNYGVAGREAHLLARTAGTSQPITTMPTVSVVRYGGISNVIVSVSTGRLLGVSDLGNTSMQAVYVLRDALTTSQIGVMTSNPGMVQQQLGSNRRIASLNPVDWSTQLGWYVNLDQSAGERVNVDPDQQYTQLAVASNVPQSSPCIAGGMSYLYYFDLATGSVLLTYDTYALTAGIGTVELTTGNSVTYQQTVAGRPPEVRPDPPRGGGTPSNLRRAGWRELVD